ncbi:MAG TPA: tetratricopeptide repeat protein, partial [Nitrospirota bacterium]|nr:tetratricopeptide repeat protein [Nitrospirota bacterium]
SFHVLSFLLHAACALLVFLIARAAFSRQEGGVPAFAVPLACALVFALHPLQTSAVTYISGMAVLLASSFWLLGLFSFIRFREGARPAYLWLPLSVLSYGLGLLSKEMAVSLPAVMLLYDLFFARPWRTGKPRALRSLAVYVPFAAVLVGYLLARKAVQGVMTYSSADYGRFEYLALQASVFFQYLRLLVFPINQNADHNMQDPAGVALTAALAALLVAAVVMVSIRRRKSQPALGFFGGWFLLALAPESSVFPIADLLVEYRVYLPSAGFFCALGAAASGIYGARARQDAGPSPPRRLKFILAAAVAAVSMMFGTLTFARNGVWQSGVSLWRDSAMKNPGAARPWHSLGHALLLEGRYDEAEAALRRALEVGGAGYAQTSGVLYALGQCLYGKGDLEGAAGYYGRAAEGGSSVEAMAAYEAVGTVRFEQGKFEEAAKIFSEITRRVKGSPQTHYNLGVSYLMLSRNAEAAEQFETAAGLGVDGFELRMNLARAWLGADRKSRARENAEAAASMDSDEAEAAEARGLLRSLER